MHVLFSQLANLSFARRGIYLKLIKNIQLDEIHPGEKRANITNYFAKFYRAISMLVYVRRNLLEFEELFQLCIIFSV